MLLVVVVVLVIIFWTAHDFKKAGAEVVNEKNIRKYLDYLVNDNGWTKSGGLIPTYTSPCGKKGCYADWERRIYAEYNKKGYTIVTFLSGQEPLYGLTRDLLVSSRKRQAAAEVRQEKHEHSQKG